MTKTAWEEMIYESKLKYENILHRLNTEDLDLPERTNLVKEIYDMGFDHGQKYVYFARSGFGQTQEEWEEQRKNQTMVLTGGDGISKTYKYNEKGELEEIIDNSINKTE